MIINMDACGNPELEFYFKASDFMKDAHTNERESSCDEKVLLLPSEVERQIEIDMPRVCLKINGKKIETLVDYYLAMDQHFKFEYQESWNILATQACAAVPFMACRDILGMTMCMDTREDSGGVWIDFNASDIVDDDFVDLADQDMTWVLSFPLIDIETKNRYRSITMIDLVRDIGASALVCIDEPRV